jgi:hypothetical protein
MSALADASSVSSFNPLAGNLLRTRDDVAAALASLFEPLRPCFSKGCGRVSIDAAGATFARATIELEGFARPLWGLAAAAAGAVDRASWWPLYRTGLASGVDPNHPDYWGEVGPTDQRVVELAAIGFALCVAPEALCPSGDEVTRQRLIAYLTAARELPCHDNNWKFFRVLIDLGLRAIGQCPNPAPVRAYLDEIEEFFIADGWYRDGSTQQIDHYVGFAFHFYGLLYARLATGDQPRKERFRARAVEFAAQFVHWFANDGAALPFGRSLTYRFACSGFWGACAFADVEALPWPVMKGLYLRHLRWWAQWPITRRDGLLSIGYGYPNPLIAESYSSANSPYWAFKAFLPLALSENHPFWSAEECSLPDRTDRSMCLPVPGMVVVHEAQQTVALCSGQSNSWVRFGAEKYAKFAYSTRYAFSIDHALRVFDEGTFDSMIAFADEEGNWRVRERCELAKLHEQTIVSRWRPWRQVLVETWLYWQRPWHVRVHRIRTPRPLRSIEGGFCLSSTDDTATSSEAALGRAWCNSLGDFSGIVDMSAVPRRGRVHRAGPNTNLLHPRHVVPQLSGSIHAGETWLITAVIASPDVVAARAAWLAPPIVVVPSVDSDGLPIAPNVVV